MPYPNEHAARLRDPADFLRIVQLWARGGVRALGGPLKTAPKGPTVIESLHFDAKMFTASQARKWCADHGHKPILFEAATAGKKTLGEMMHRGLVEIDEVRSIDVAKRFGEFVASTENGVRTWRGIEYLSMAGCSLDRYLKNNVVVDSHRRESIQDVLGSAAIRIEKRLLIAGITFATTARAADACTLALVDKCLKAISIGYGVDPEGTVTLAKDQTYDMNGRTVTGPCVVQTKWELYEVSVLPVGADPDAVLRALSADGELADRLLRAIGGADMAKEGTEETNVETETAATGTPPATTPPPPATPSEEVRRAEIAEGRRREILALAPDDLKDVAERCILENLSVEDSRKRLLAEHTKRCAPAGSGEAPPAAGAPPKGETRQLKDLSTKEFAGAFGR